jgi:hypothetical protein
MTNERLYQLAHEALEAQWFKTYERSKAFPELQSLKAREQELLDALLELEREMKMKGYKKGWGK